MGEAASEFTLSYRMPRSRPGWTLQEETLPESALHDDVVTLLRSILVAWAARVGGLEIFRNLAIRWDAAAPRVGVDPDVAVFRPPPPCSRDELRSVRTWEPGFAPPVVGIEVVSETHPSKDYSQAPEKYGACGVQELWIFDPLLAGPTSMGGPVRLQLWERSEHGVFQRTYAGDGPVRSPTVGGYLVVVHEGRRLRIADDAEGTSFWLTPEEAERAAKEAERAAKEAERAAKEAERAAREDERAAREAERVAKEAALARVAELEALLRK